MQPASAAGWGWQLGNRRSAAASAGTAGGVGWTGTDAPPIPLRSLGWAAIKPHLAWSRLLLAGVAFVVASGFIHPVAYRIPTLRSATETATAVFAVIAAWWIGAEFVHTRRLRTLLLLGALLTLTETDLIGSALPAMLHIRSANSLAVVLPLGQLAAAAALTAAALTPSDRLVTSSRRPLADAVALSIVSTGLAEACGLALRGHLLAAAVYRSSVLGAASHDPLGVIVLLSTVGLFGYAAMKFAQRGRLEACPWLSLVAGAAFVFAASRLYYLALPWSSPGAITVRDLLRLIAFGLVFAAAVRKDLEIRRTITRAAAMAERSRVAQDLHDGLAQDLAFIAAHGARLANDLGDEHPLAVAARRALALSRGTIGELSDNAGASSREALHAVAAELRGRFGIAIAVDVQREAEADRQVRDNVTRIAREAIANAVRHGQARNVVVSLKRTSAGVALRVRDDGCGFPGASADGRTGGFGLVHMRDRAALLGGSFAVRTPRSGGTELEIIFP